MSIHEQQLSVFPTRTSSLALALAEDQPILIDGMKVLFDEKVALFPVTLKPQAKQERPNGS
jgi:hypothetical protein